jgi:glycine betaine/proline transport system permease protein
MSAALEVPEAVVAAPPAGEQAPRGRSTPGRGSLLGILVAVYVVGAVALNGHQTLTVARSDLSAFQRWGNRVNNSIGGSQGSNPILQVLNQVSSFFNSIVARLQDLFSDAPAGRPVPEVGWLGVLALAALIVLAVAGWRMAVGTVVAFVMFGTFGYWEDSINTLIVTFVAVVFVLVIGIPLGLWMGNSRRVTAIVTPVLDVAQTFPSFVYLLPITLFFGIGPAAAVVVTAIYAAPPVIRITAEGVRAVDEGVLEATSSLGTTARQRLLSVQLPMARRTIIVGINQSIMAALSMVTIAAFINSPGLGVPVLTALQSLDVGTAFTAGVLIAVMAIWLDRATTAAGEQTMVLRTASGIRNRRIVLLVALVATVIAVYLSRTYLDLAQFPSSPDLGKPVSDGAQSVADWVSSNGSEVTRPITNAFTYGLLNPLQSLLADSPFWLTAGFLLLLAWIVGGVRSGVTAIVCLAIIFGVGIWHESMVTLASALVGTVVVVVLALIFGVWLANDRRADVVIRPVLDAAQTIPPFVYLIPALALFGTTRFTAIVAAVIYGAPVAIKLVADGIRGVSPSTIEAARSAGSSRWQLISKVQLPMARSSIALAANQGLLYVFAVVVIGGLVGAGGLGYLVSAGFSQSELFGKGAAAGIAIVALAVMFDRMTQGWVARSDPSASPVTI